MKRAFHDWAWIHIGRRGFGFCIDEHRAFPWLVFGASFLGVRVPLTRYYLSTYRKPESGVFTASVEPRPMTAGGWATLLFACAFLGLMVAMFA